MVDAVRLAKPGQKPAVLVEQRHEMFLAASALLGQDYRHELGHKVIAQVGRGGLLALAVLTDIVVGVRAELTMWSSQRRGMAGRDLLRAVCRVVFDEWRCTRLHAVIATRNVKSIAGAVAMGFVAEATLGRWFGQDDGVMYRLYREQCRWLNKGVNHEGLSPNA